MNYLINNTFFPGEHHSYVVGGNLMNAFVMGNIGSEDDFFLVGAEPPDESGYPLLSGNVLDSEGDLLFRLLKNRLDINPGRCKKVQSDLTSYEIVDSSGVRILEVSTLFADDIGGGTFVTTLDGNFYNKDGLLVVETKSEGRGHIKTGSVKTAFGFSGSGFGLVIGMDKNEREMAMVALQSGG